MVLKTNPTSKNKKVDPIALSNICLVMCTTKKHTLNNTVQEYVNFLILRFLKWLAVSPFYLFLQVFFFFFSLKQVFMFIKFYLVSSDPLFYLAGKLIEP